MVAQSLDPVPQGGDSVGEATDDCRKGAFEESPARLRANLSKDDHLSLTPGYRKSSAQPNRRKPPEPSSPCPRRVVAPPRLALLASDPVTADCAVAYLSSAPAVRLLPPEQSAEAEAILVLALNVTGETLTSIERLVREASGATPPVVLVADSISRSHLVRAISHGLVSFLPRPQTGMERAVQAVLAARTGHADLPHSMIRVLIEQVRAGRESTARTPGPTGLNEREIDVLSLVADGLSTSEIAHELNYSEKTIKNILHSMTARLGLRNRAHAVAYALRAGIVEGHPQRQPPKGRISGKDGQHPAEARRGAD